MDYAIRPAVQSDAIALARLIRSLGMFRQVQREDTEATHAHVEAHLAGCLTDDSHSVYVAVDREGAPLGYTSVHWLPFLFLAGPVGFVSELFVRESHRGCGIGGALLDEVVKAARERGCARLELSALRSRESYARRFYPKRGWEERPDMADFILELKTSE